MQRLRASSLLRRLSGQRRPPPDSRLPGIAGLRPGQLRPERRIRARRRKRWLRALLIAVCLPALPLLPLRWIDPPVTSYMLQSVAPLAERRWVRLDDMGPHWPLAAVASEDQRFPAHWGFDWLAIRTVLTAPGQARRGASSISQQTVKNLFLWPGGWSRKLIEAWLTGWMELLWPKSRILEVYLNIAEFGPGVYGVWAGSRHHYGLGPGALSRDQVGRLIALLPNPRRLTADSPAVIERSRWIAQQMHALGPAHLQGIAPPRKP